MGKDCLSLPPRLERILLAVLLTVGLGINGVFLCRRFSWALTVYRRMQGLSNDQRRLLIYGPLYKDIVRAQQLIPEKAIIWWVSPEFPWRVSYFLYPRLLKWGSPKAAERERFHHLHLSDWVIGYSANGEHLELLAPIDFPRKGRGLSS